MFATHNSLYTIYMISTDRTIAVDTIPISKMDQRINPKLSIYDPELFDIIEIERPKPVPIGVNAKLDSYAIFGKRGVSIVSLGNYHDVYNVPVEPPPIDSRMLFYSAAPLSDNSLFVLDGLNAEYYVYNLKGEMVLARELLNSFDSFFRPIVIDDLVYVITDSSNYETVSMIDLKTGDINVDPFGLEDYQTYLVDIKSYGFAALNIGDGLEILYGNVGRKGGITGSVVPKLDLSDGAYTPTSISLSMNGLFAIALQPPAGLPGDCRVFIVDKSGNVVMEKRFAVKTTHQTSDSSELRSTDVCYAGFAGNVSVIAMVDTERKAFGYGYSLRGIRWQYLGYFNHYDGRPTY